MSTRTRFAPSPTGYLHIGSLRTALYCYLWAKKEGGEYLLRIEDTDQSRYVEGSVENLINCLASCGIKSDEGPVIQDGKIAQVGNCGPYFQSQRLDLYHKYAKQLVAEGKAYYCFCTKDRLDTLRQEQTEKGLTPKYDSKCSHNSHEETEKLLASGTPYVIRMKLEPHKDVKFNDVVKGEVTINTDDMDEQVLIKQDGFPTYHFAVVIDDHFMNINCVIRGEEWLVSTPKHILLYEAFGWEPPTFVHLPNVLNFNKKKLSKRDGSVSVDDFLKKGYLPEALVNYITLLGWSSPDGKEIFSLDESITQFDLKRINNSGAVFDVAKLDWMNAQYIKSLPTEELSSKILPYLTEAGIKLSDEHLQYASVCVKDRISTLGQSVDEIRSILRELDTEITDEVKEVFAFETNAKLYEEFTNFSNDIDEFNPENVAIILKKLQKEVGIKGKNLYMGLRVAVMHEVHGADLASVICILGKETVLARLKDAKKYL